MSSVNATHFTHTIQLSITIWNVKTLRKVRSTTIGHSVWTRSHVLGGLGWYFRQCHGTAFDEDACRRISASYISSSSHHLQWVLLRPKSSFHALSATQVAPCVVASAKTHSTAGKSISGRSVCYSCDPAFVHFNSLLLGLEKTQARMSRAKEEG